MVANVFERLRSLVLSAFLIVCLSLPAFAGAFEDAVAKFANDEFSDTEEAVGAIKDDRQFAGCARAILLAHALREDPRMPTAHDGFSRRRDAKAKTRARFLCCFHGTPVE